MVLPKNAIFASKQLKDNIIMKSNSFVLMIAVVILTICFTGCGESNKTTPSNNTKNTVETKTMILPFMNERQKQLKEMGQSGQITKAQFDEMMEADNSVYRDMLISTDLSQFKTYTDAYNTDGSTVLIEINDNQQRKELRDVIRLAISENRIQWNAAKSGDAYGTYITILPKAVNGEIKGINRGMTIFVVGLFEKSVKNAFDCVNTNNDSIG